MFCENAETMRSMIGVGTRVQCKYYRFSLRKKNEQR